MIAALALGMVLGGAAAVITYTALGARERRQASRSAARLRDWERIARLHTMVRADVGQVRHVR